MTDKAPIGVMLVEDDELLRLGVRTLIETEPDLAVVGDFCDAEVALAAHAAIAPSVVLLDLRLPGMDGIEFTRKLRAVAPDARILVLSYYQGDHDVFLALKAGALGYLPKGVHGSELLVALRTVAAGRRYFHSEISGRLIDGSLDAGLSRREGQILQGMAQGLTNPQIAETLKISPRTVSMFVSRILQKLGASTRTEAVSIAMRRGLVRKDER